MRGGWGGGPNGFEVHLPQADLTLQDGLLAVQRRKAPEAPPPCGKLGQRDAAAVPGPWRWGAPYSPLLGARGRYLQRTVAPRTTVEVAVARTLLGTRGAMRQPPSTPTYRAHRHRLHTAVCSSAPTRAHHLPTPTLPPTHSFPRKMAIALRSAAPTRYTAGSRASRRPLVCNGEQPNQGAGEAPAPAWPDHGGGLMIELALVRATPAPLCGGAASLRDALAPCEGPAPSTSLRPPAPAETHNAAGTGRKRVRCQDHRIDETLGPHPQAPPQQAPGSHAPTHQSEREPTHATPPPHPLTHPLTTCARAYPMYCTVRACSVQGDAQAAQGR